MSSSDVFCRYVVKDKQFFAVPFAVDAGSFEIWVGGKSVLKSSGLISDFIQPVRFGNETIAIKVKN